MGQLFSKFFIYEKSFSQELCLRSDPQNRQSFSDRICDDLCEEILQYLSLEDKLRLQCVSKQFQRTVFQRQYELYICVRQRVFLSTKFPNDDSYHIEVHNLDSIKVLLKKCPNITSIEFDGEVNEVFPLIIENCNNLSEIILFDLINGSNLQEFYQKFGPKIKYFRSLRQVIDLNRFPNIKKVVITYLYDHSIIAQLKLAKLKQIAIVFNQGEEHKLETVIDNFPTLTHFNVCINSRDENAVYESLKSISNLKHLIHFGFHNGFGKINKRFCDLVKQMANIYQNLKSFDCTLTIDQKSDIRQLLSELKAFPALKRLNLCLCFFNMKNANNEEDSDSEDIEQDIDVNQLFSFELFKGFSNITHLTLNFYEKPLNESILKEIDINLPKLQYLIITDSFDTTPKGVTQMADILSRLSRLETLKLKFKSGVDFKLIEEQINKKCRKIKTIEIKIDNNSNDSESD